MFSPIKQTGIGIGLSVTLFLLTWLPGTGGVAFIMWDIFFLASIVLFFHAAGTKKELAWYFVISVLLLTIPVYVLEYYSSAKIIHTYRFVPQTAGGLLMWMSHCIPWTAAFTPLFLTDFSQKSCEGSKISLVYSLCGWGIFIVLVYLDYRILYLSL